MIEFTIIHYIYIYIFECICIYLFKLALNADGAK